MNGKVEKCPYANAQNEGKERKRMEYINPLFGEQKIIKKEQTLPSPTHANRKIRGDKKHNVN